MAKRHRWQDRDQWRQRHDQHGDIETEVEIDGLGAARLILVNAQLFYRKRAEILYIIEGCRQELDRRDRLGREY